MNTLDVMRYGHQAVLRAVEGLEAMLVDVLAASHDDAAETPVLDEFLAGPAQFNDAQVARRDQLAPGAVLGEY